MRSFSLPLAALLMLVSPTRGADAPTSDNKTSDNKLTVAGVFSITAPAGYSWQALQEAGPGTPGVYMATADGKEERLVVVMEPRNADNDAKRPAILKAHFNAMGDTVQKAGMKDLKFEQPKLTPPIAATSDYWISAQPAEGDRKFFYGHTTFGKNTFQVQAAGGEKGAKDLIASAKTLKELAK